MDKEAELNGWYDKMVGVKYSCDVCKKEFDNEAEAIACQSQPPKKCNYHIGDLIDFEHKVSELGYPYTRTVITEYLVVGFDTQVHNQIPLLAEISGCRVSLHRINLDDEFVKLTPREYVDKATLKRYIKLIEKDLAQIRLKRLNEIYEHEWKMGILSYLSPKFDESDD